MRLANKLFGMVWRTRQKGAGRSIESGDKREVVAVALPESHELSLEEKLAAEVIGAVDSFADEVTKYARRENLDLKGLYDAIILKGEKILPDIPNREFLHIGFYTGFHPVGPAAYVSYEFSEMLGARGLEKNRVGHFNYSHSPEDEPKSDKSFGLAGKIEKLLRAKATATEEESSLNLSIFKTSTSDGTYLIKYGFGNPFGNYKYEPRFLLSKLLVLEHSVAGDQNYFGQQTTLGE